MTESTIPLLDLVVLVFETKDNPHEPSFRKFLTFSSLLRKTGKSRVAEAP